ncbi:DUF4350 domain-containing protein [Gracilibacillus sp. S3-1-1]|uniref:DUF4350 domain-containing protein n=1 Tax=Gracilibacillus pellucidus TaxID=3095368 RepID=A0ACC6M5Z8_9BACI|nr:DUF4350 domain-containing protein [Gracilibacillus sp. S3-1-1]MDX8046386.1 DUF4350 domain-containing protein [Gracilibacillus sp. S3-1-1]
MNGKKIWIIGMVFFLLLIGASIFSTSQTPKSYPPYLVESPAPTGLKALYTYLGENGYDVTEEDRLPALSDQALRILVSPPVFTDNRTEEHYLDYIRQGNTLVLAKNNPDGLFSLKTDYVMPETVPEEEVNTEAESQERTLHLMNRNSVRLSLETDDHILLEDEYGALAIEREIGNGSLIVLVEPDWLMNQYITEYDHTEAVFNLIPFEKANKIVFDEYSADTSRGTLSQFELYPGWAYTLLVQGLMITIFILWYQGKRFGPIYPVREETVRLSNQRLKAIAIWQTKGKNYYTSVEYQLEYLKEAIRSRYGIPYHQSWQKRLVTLAEHNTQFSANELRKIAQSIETIGQRKTLNKSEYLSLSTTIDKIREEVEQR